MATDGHSAALDKLQANVNLVLEQSGRVFAAMSEDSSKLPTAQINKLKQVVPKAYGDFNDALDTLEETLQFAQSVMRRDLALWRERAGLQTEPAIEQHPAQSPDTDLQKAVVPNHDTLTDENDTAQHVESAAASAEITMEDSKPEQLHTTTEQPKLDVDMAEDSAPIKTGTPAAVVEATTETQAQPDPGTQTSTQSTTPDAKKSEPNLQVDTKIDTTILEKSTEDEKAPDTAKESVNNDLDSLFGGGGGDHTNDPNNEFTFDENADGDLDFSDFTHFNTDNADNGDNDNISSLLPGLEDYANTQTNNLPHAELDLNSFFNTDGNNQNNGNSTNNNNASTQRDDNNTDQHDTTFDDLMDLNFDGQGMDDANNTADLDFDSLFN